METFEWSPQVELLAQLFVLIQQNVHATATHGSKAARRRPPITHYPTPSTAARRGKRSEKRKAFETVESLIVFTDEPYGPDSPYVVHPEPTADTAVPAPESHEAGPDRLHRLNPLASGFVDD